MGMFNEEQMDHMRDLAHMAKEGKVCPCGWFSKADCSRRCNSAYGSPEAEAAARAKSAKATA